MLFSVKVFATAQVPDYLIINKDTLKIHSNPLEEYFKVNPFPENLITMRSSGNWRGYVAFFKLIDNRLVVENIYKENHDVNEGEKYKYVLKSIYKDVFGDKKYFPCDYYSGLLVCPYGEMLQYVHMGYSSLYENYKLFEIKSGINVKSKELSGKGFQDFKIDYYKYFKTTREYKIKSDEFKKMMIEINKDIEKSYFDNEDSSQKEKLKKENIFLKQKEAEFKLDKEVDSFMFLFLDDYIKTIDIPKKE